MSSQASRCSGLRHLHRSKATSKFAMRPCVHEGRHPAVVACCEPRAQIQESAIIARNWWDGLGLCWRGLQLVGCGFGIVENSYVSNRFDAKHHW
eukprot:3508564-Amphidinium_carterae.1